MKQKDSMLACIIFHHLIGNFKAKCEVLMIGRKLFSPSLNESVFRNFDPKVIVSFTEILNTKPSQELSEV